MSLFDLKALATTLDQLEQEKKIPREKIIDAIEQALAAAYKKDYGKKGQIIRAHFDPTTGDLEFQQIKIVVDDSLVREPKIIAEGEEVVEEENPEENDGDTRIVFNPEHHMYIDDARRMKSDVMLEEELVFPLESHDDFGRIAAQTAKQVIIQRIREAEKQSIIEEFADRQGDIVVGTVQKVERGSVLVDIQGITGIIPREEQISGEFYRTGQRIRAYLYLVEETPRGVMLRLSRSHPRFIEVLFALESPEIASGSVEIKSIAREAGSRSKIAVASNDAHIDPIGACVGQKGTRVTTVMQELGGEKIDIIPWSENPSEFISSSLAPAKVLDIALDESAHSARIEVAEDQLSLAIGKGGQNVRLAAKLTGWKIDIAGTQTTNEVADNTNTEETESSEEIADEQ